MMLAYSGKLRAQILSASRLESGVVVVDGIGVPVPLPDVAISYLL